MSISKEEQQLTKEIFGDYENFHAELNKLDPLTLSDDSSIEDSDNSQDADDLFYVDKAGSSSELSDADSSSNESESEEEIMRCWHDSDDEHNEVDLTLSNRTKKLRNNPQEQKISGSNYEFRLRKQFETFFKRPKWALNAQKIANVDSDVDMDDDMDDDDSALKTTSLSEVLNNQTSYISKSQTKILDSHDLDIQRLTDVTKNMKSQSVIQCISFHRTQPLLLSCGYDQSLRIYEVDGKINKVATSLYIQNSPFKTARFHPDGKRVFAAGRRKYMFIWDLETGNIEKLNNLYGHEDTISSFERFEISPCGMYVALLGVNGYVNFLDGNSGTWIANCKIEGDLADLRWHDKSVIIASKQGTIYEFDLLHDKFVNVFKDDAIYNLTKLAYNSKYTAVGMANGLVSIYENITKRCVATLENLVTEISSLEFSSDGQMLVMASRITRDALRIVHLPSFRVFKNWPTSATPLGHVSALEFTPNNQMLAIGNEGGFIRLFGLNHYIG